MKKLLSVVLLCALLLSLSACSDPVIGESQGEEPLGADASSVPEAVISLEGDSVRIPGKGVALNGCVVTIGAPGSYTVRGTLNDGRIIIDLKENPGKVSLYLDGADITCLTDSAIYLLQAKELNLVLADGSHNRVVSGTEADLASYSETRQGAAIFAEDDLDIQGSGSLEVYGYLNNGITCKDDLKIKGGSLTVLAANNGVRASESITLTDGSVAIEAGNDGLKTSSAKKADKGFVQIEGGQLSVRCTGDAVSAESELRISGGTIDAETTGDPSSASAKGLKGKTGVTISGGTIRVTAQDHAIRSGAALTVSGGTITACSLQGKGLNAETELCVENGALTVSAADDGLACADTVRILGGELAVSSGADGIQGGKKGTGFGDTVGTVSIEGGSVRISAFNKPVDAKAVFTIAGGTVFACGSGSFAPSASLPYVLCTADGRAGADLFLSADSEFVLHASYLFHTVYFAGETLNAGQSYTLHIDAQTLDAKAVG